jgi:hypothetical protein
MNPSPLHADQTSGAFSIGPNLFIDDYLITESAGLTRALHQPEKLAVPVLRRGAAWHLQPQWFMHVERDPQSGRFRTWYIVKNPGGRPAIAFAYAESEDGVSWQLPDLGLVDVDGSLHNNLIDAPQGHFGLFLVDEGPKFRDRSRRYKLAYFVHGGTRERNGASIAFSADGLRFRDYAGNPVIRESETSVPYYAPGYENTIGDILDGCWDPLRQEYLMGCKISHPGYPGQPHHHSKGWRRCVGITTSKDFVSWERPMTIITPDPGNGIEEFYGFKPSVRGNLYLGFLRVLRDDLPATPGGPVEGIGWTELLTSRDGKTWTRHQGAFIDRTITPGAWDHAMAWYADSVTLGSQEFIYYGGYSAGHKVGDREVGLARLRKNGFVSLDAGAAGGVLRTFAARFPGSALTLNAVVRGELRVRILSEDGRALEGFDWEDCRPVQGDSVAHRIEWRGRDALPDECPCRLELSLKDAACYGFDFA